MSLNFGGEPSGKSGSIDYPALLRKLRREFVDTSGDTMTGNLSVPRAIHDNHAVSKSLLDAHLYTQRRKLEIKINEEKAKLETTIRNTSTDILNNIEQIRVALISSIDSVRTLLDREKRILLQLISQLQTTTTEHGSSITENEEKIEELKTTTTAQQTNITELQATTNTQQTTITSVLHSTGINRSRIATIEERLSMHVVAVNRKLHEYDINHFDLVDGQMVFKNILIDMSAATIKFPGDGTFGLYQRFVQFRTSTFRTTGSNKLDVRIEFKNLINTDTDKHTLGTTLNYIYPIVSIFNSTPSANRFVSMVIKDKSFSSNKGTFYLDIRIVSFVFTNVAENVHFDNFYLEGFLGISNNRSHIQSSSVGPATD